MHLFLYLALTNGYGYNTKIWLIGEAFVIMIEFAFYYFSKIIPSAKKSFLASVLFNTSSIIIAKIINLFI